MLQASQVINSGVKLPSLLMLIMMDHWVKAVWYSLPQPQSW